MKKTLLVCLIISIAAIAYAADYSGTTSNAELDFVTGVTSAIQDQLDALTTKWTNLGATHDTSGELDALYEAELDNLAGLAAALSDEGAYMPTLLGFADAAEVLSGIGASDLNALTNADKIRIATTTDAHEFCIQAYDVDDTTWDDVLCFTNGNQPTVELGAGATFSGIGDIATDGSISGQALTQTDAAGAIALTVNAVNYGTDTGDADIPDTYCDAAGDVGNWVVLISSAADAYSLTSNDASNQFIITDNASALTAGDELDVDGTMVSVMCIAAELWKVTGYMGAVPTDGGTAD